jgi:UDP:flavonoid glycosyltransferase YjiC (YdhE family)
MSKTLIAWELGSGLGHVGPLRAIGAELVRRGHSVAIAASNTALYRKALAKTRRD